jgi:hypothetical protein
LRHLFGKNDPVDVSKVASPPGYIKYDPLENESEEEKANYNGNGVKKDSLVLTRLVMLVRSTNTMTFTGSGDK